MVGRVGGDAFAQVLLANLAENGVDSSGVQQDPDQATGAALILVGAGGQNLIALAPGANRAVGPADVDRAVVRLGRGDWLVMQLEIPMAAVDAAAERASAMGAHILLNAAPSQHLETALLRRLDVLVLNEHEVEAVEATTTGLASAASALRSQGVGMVVVTLGARGALLCDQQGQQYIDAYGVQPVDTTGAGDAFVGALAVSLAANADPRAAVRFANAAGAAATASLGAQKALPRMEDLHRLFGVQPP
jgi:ribokinase